MLGSEFAKSKGFGLFEKIYIALLGMPVLGLRIRAWRMLPVIKKYSKQAKRVLDMGSGRGVFTIEVAKHLPGSEVIGVDLMQERVQNANELVQKIGLKNCSFEAVDIFDKSFAKRFDVIITIDVLEHIQDDAAVVKKLFELLNPDGKLIVHVPHLYRNLFGVKRINFDIEGHVRAGYLLPDLEKLIKTSGFKVLESGYTYSSLETLANDLAYGITKGREQGKILYSLCFPLFLFIAYCGKIVRPKYGSGVYLVAAK